MDQRLHTELWTSWASLLRSYAAAHGMNSTQHAVVEVSVDEITVRVGTRWIHFTSSEMRSSDNATDAFTLTEDGSVCLGDATPEEMDFAAERLTREMMHKA